MDIIDYKWVFKTKFNADGTLDCLKARLVENFFYQVDVIHYNETFSSVIHPYTIWIVITLALINHWDIRQLDLKNAFLHGNLKKSVYMEQPPSLSIPPSPLMFSS